MGTRGVFILKIKENIIGFHMCGNGYSIMKIYKKYKEIKDPIEILMKCLEYFSEGYTDNPYMNIYYEKYDSEKDYSIITAYTLYFDGVTWVGHRFHDLIALEEI